MRHSLILHRLFLKSAAIPSVESSASPAHAVLCTPTKTYQLRQVQTSNTVLVARPRAVTHDSDLTPQNGLCAFATCTSTLELQILDRTESSKLKTALQWLEDSIPIFTGEGDVADRPSLNSKAEIVADVPYSDADCDEAWISLLAFEWNRECWRPTPDVMVAMWQSINQVAIEQDIDLTSRFDLGALKEAAEDLDVPTELIDALFRCISQENSHGEYDGKVVLDKTATIGWIGEALVRASPTGETGMGVWQVLERWQNMLPEKWRKDVTTKEVMALRSKMKRSPAGSLPDDMGSADDQQNGKRPSTARNWHEKFKRARKSDGQV